MDDALQERIEALERTVADGEFDTDLADLAELEQRLSAVESQLEAIDNQIDNLEAATQALRGYVGNIRAVNDEVEQRANSALAKAEAIEATLDEDTQHHPTQPASNEATTQPTASVNTDEWSRSSPTDGHSVVGGEVSTPGSHQPGPTGGGAAGNQDAGECCRVCGRREQKPGSKTTTAPGVTDGGGGATTTDSRQRPDDTLVPGESDETGTLQRIREML